jgi:hypothetical protein
MELAMTFNEIFKRSVERSIDLSRLLPFDASNKQQLFAISLYGSMIDCAHSLNILIDGKASAGAPLMVRPMLEAYVGLRLVVEDPEYVSYMDANFFRTWVKRLNEAESQNPYLASLATRESFDAIKAQYESRTAELADKNFRNLRIEDKFRRAGMIDVYNSVYSILSDHAHSSIGALINRHFAMRKGGGLEVIFLRDPDEDEFEVYESTAAELILEAGILLHRKFATAKEGPLLALKLTLKEMIAREGHEAALQDEVAE